MLETYNDDMFIKSNTMKELKQYERKIRQLLESQEIHPDFQKEIINLVVSMLWGEIVAKEHFINQSTKALIDLYKTGVEFIELPTENEIEQMAESKSWADGAKWVLERIKFVS